MATALGSSNVARADVSTRAAVTDNGSDPAIAVYKVDGISRFLWSLLGVILLLGVAREIAIAVIGTETVLKDLRHFALDAERSLPSWYENLSMGASAVLLAIVAKLAIENDRQNRVQWWLLAIVFALMSIDAAASFHEISVRPLREGFGLSGIFYYSWVVLAAPIVALLGIYFIPFLLRIPRQTAIGFVLAGTVFVGGALGTELICGYLATTTGIESPQYKAVAALQECMEATGMTIFIVTILRHLSLKRTGIVVR